jgi:hypothetical protein
VKAYAAAGFDTAPEATLSFIKRFDAANVEAEEVPQRLLAPYEERREVARMRAIKRLESSVAEAEAHAVQQWMQIMRGLGLSV